MKVFVLCRSDAVAAQWRERAPLYAGIELVPRTGYRSFYAFINEVLADGGDAPAALCHDDVWFGLDFAALVAALRVELERDWPNWGVCGNAGVQWDGRAVFRHLFDPHGGPQRAAAPKPALGIDGNLMLLNLPALKDVRLPDLGGFHGYDIVLGLEALRAGLAVLVDQRLLTVHASRGDGAGFAAFSRGDAFQHYFGQRFINTHLVTLNGLVDTSGAVSFDFLASPGLKTAQDDVVALFDRAIAQARPRPPLVTVVCRTQLDRPEMLTRAVSSFAVAANEAPDLLRLAVRIVTDRPEAALAAEVARLRDLAPQLDLDGWHAAVRPGRVSRMDLLLHAAERAEGDYLWFVDDDDFVLPSAMRPLGRALQPGKPLVMVGDSVRYEERWSDEAGRRSLLSSHALSTVPWAGVFTALMGDNATPICSVLFPRAVLRDRIDGLWAHGDYYEDFFLLVRVLTAPGVEVVGVHTTLCGISVRGTENTITAPDRSRWNLSYATFIGEIMGRRDDSPFLWQLAMRQPLVYDLPGAARLPPSIRRVVQLASAVRAVLLLLRNPRRIGGMVRNFAFTLRTGGLKAALLAVIRFGSR